MTVNSIDSIADFDTNGITTSFPFFFKFLANADLVVTYVGPTGVSVVLTLGTQYTVTGAGTDDGGSVVTPTPLAGPGKLVVAREMDAYQLTSLRNQGKFLAETHEDVFDKLTMLIQQSFASFTRALSRPFGRDYFYAENRRITSVKDPEDAQDAVTQGWTSRFVAGLVAAIQGPINNAANIFFLKPNGAAAVVQDLSSATGATMIRRGTSTVDADLTSAEARVTYLEQHPRSPIGYAATPAEETLRFAEGFAFVLRTDLIIPAPPPVPTYILDSSVTTTPTGSSPFQGSGVVGGYFELAVGFVASVTGVLGRVEIPVVYKSGTASDWTIEIRADSAGGPTGAPLASASLGAFTTPATDAAALASPRIVTFAFNQTAGVKYWLCFRVLAASSNSVYGLLWSGTGPGNLATRATSSGAWTVESSAYNIVYKTYRVTYT